MAEPIHVMKRTGKANKAAAPPVPLGLRGKSRYTFREIDEWLRSLGAKPMSRKTEARLRKAGFLGMADK